MTQSMKSITKAVVGIAVAMTFSAQAFGQVGAVKQGARAGKNVIKKGGENAGKARGTIDGAKKGLTSGAIGNAAKSMTEQEVEAMQANAANDQGAINLEAVLSPEVLESWSHYMQDLELAFKQGAVDATNVNECLASLDEPGLKDRWTTIVTTAAYELERAGQTANSANPAVLKKTSILMTEEIARLVEINSATEALSRTNKVVDACSINGRLKPARVGLTKADIRVN